MAAAGPAPAVKVPSYVASGKRLIDLVKSPAWAQWLCETPAYAAGMLLLLTSVIFECLGKRLTGDLSFLQSLGSSLSLLLSTYACIAIVLTWRHITTVGTPPSIKRAPSEGPEFGRDYCSSTESQSTIAPGLARLDNEQQPHPEAELQHTDPGLPSIPPGLIDETTLALLMADPALAETVEAILREQQQQPFQPCAPSQLSALAPPFTPGQPPPSNEEDELAALFQIPVNELFRFFHSSEGLQVLPLFYQKLIENAPTLPIGIVADLMRFPVKAPRPCPEATVALCHALLRVPPNERGLTTMQIALVCWSVTRSHQTFQSRRFSTSLAEFDKLAHNVLLSMAEEALEKAEDFQPLSIANLSWSFGKMNFRAGQKVLVRLASVAARQLRSFNAQNIANTYWALGTLEINSSALTPRWKSQSQQCNEICSTLKEKLGGFNSQALANFVWACAKLGWCPPVVMASVASEAAAKISEFKPQELANFMWAAAKLDAGTIAGSAVALFADRAASQIYLFNSQEVSNAYWALATLDMRYTRLTPAAVSCAAPNSTTSARTTETFVDPDEFAKQETSTNSLSSLTPVTANGESRVVSPETLEELQELQTAPNGAHPSHERLVSVLVAKLRDFNPQAIANFLWACAKLQWNVPSLISASHALVLRNAEQFRPQNIANVLWAHAKMKIRHAAIVRTLTQVAAARVRDFNTQELANIYWALGTLDFRESALTPAVEDTRNSLIAVVASKIESFKPQELSNVVWGFARLRWKAEPLLSKACYVALQHVHAFKPQEIGNLVWALAKLDYPAEGLIRAMTERAAQTMHNFTTQNVANIYWALGYFSIEGTPLDPDDVERPDLTQKLLRFVAAFNDQELCNFAIVFGKLQWKCDALLQAIKERVTLGWQNFRKHELGTMVNAFRRLQQDDIVALLGEHLGYDEELQNL